MTGYLILCLATGAYSLVARRLSSTILTAPIVFLAMGVLISRTGLVSAEGLETLLHPVAAVTLIVLLFLDAAKTDVTALLARHIWPMRMLLIGLPLVIFLGTLAGHLFLPAWPLVAVAMVAAILAPTDAALGQAVVVNPNVPERVRRSLTVESGLNDGMALPAVLFFASLTAHGAQSGSEWLVFGAKQILLGPLAGAAIGLAGGWTLIRAQERGLTSSTYEGIASLAMAGAAYLFALQIGGNGFIAAFVAGLGFGAIVKGRCAFVYEFTESEGQLLAWAAFLLLGAALVPEAVVHLTMPMLGLILLSLLVLRPLAIWISLIGSDAAPVTRLFFGWFGPRGLATALFALIVIDQVPPTLGEQVLYLAVNTIWISAVLHGISAAPAAKWYSKKVVAMAPCAETQPVDSSAVPLVTRDQ